MQRIVFRTFAFGGIAGGVYGFTNGWYNYVESRPRRQAEYEDYSPIGEITASTVRCALIGASAPISIPLSVLWTGMLVAINITAISYRFVG